MNKKDVGDRIIRIVSQVMAIDTATLELNIIDDLNADSLDQIELVMAIEDEFDIEIPDEDAENMKTIEDIRNYVSDKLL